MSISNGAVFWMSPDNGPSGSAVVAQITVAAGSGGTVTMGAQGRSASGDDWSNGGISFALGSGGGCQRSNGAEPSGHGVHQENVRDYLQRRNRAEELRATGMISGGPAALDKKDVQAFANALDRTLALGLKRS